MRERGVQTGGVDQFARPPGVRFVEATAVVISGQIVNLLATVFPQRTKLPDDLSPFRVLRRAYLTRNIAQIKCDVPIKTGCGLRLAKLVSQTLSGTVFLVPTQVGVRKNPHSEHLGFVLPDMRIQRAMRRQRQTGDYRAHS